VAFTARADDLQHGLDALDQARQQQAPGAAAAAGTLRPVPTGLATATIAPDYLTLYGRAAATCPGLPWVVLAAIGSVESAHGQSSAPGVASGANVAGAMGPMQFLAGTWAAFGVDGNGDGFRDVYNRADAIFGAANYLCASGAGDLSTLRRALWDYNHADWYVEAVLQLAARY
jgi:membrane-bound lytic murein transglycosylase B